VLKGDRDYNGKGMTSTWITVASTQWHSLLRLE
jgi:hypothetical protein